MTLLEVAVALAIFSIGILYLIKADQVVYHYQRASEERQQVMFAASGQMEKMLNLLESGQLSATVPYTDSSSLTIGEKQYTIQSISTPDVHNNPQLDQITVIITPEGGSPQDALTLEAYGAIPLK